MKEIFRISSIIIAKNEAQNIRRCIESQINCIDEIIVLIDKDTNDETVEIVKSFPKVKWEIIEWMGYGKTKQYGVDKSENEWILWIDADEAITPKLGTELNSFKSSIPSCNAYKIARRAYFLGKWIKHSGWYPGYVSRLFNKQFARFSLSEVHEHLIVEGNIEELNNDLEHYTDPNIFHYYEKFNRYTSLAAAELKTKGKSAKLNDLLLRPFFIFVKMYILKQGFLDGIQGFMLAVFSANYVFTKYSKLWELKNRTN